MLPQGKRFMAAWMIVGAVLDGACISGFNAALRPVLALTWNPLVGFFSGAALPLFVLWIVHAMVMPFLVVGRPSWRQGRRLALMGSAFVVLGGAVVSAVQVFGLSMFMAALFSGDLDVGGVRSTVAVQVFILVPNVVGGALAGMVLHPFLRAALPAGTSVPFWQNVLGVTSIYAVVFALDALASTLGPFKEIPSAATLALWRAKDAAWFLLHLWFVGRAVRRSLQKPTINAPAGG